MEIIHAIGPLIIVGAIVLFVIKRLKKMQKQGKLVKRKSKNEQILVDSFISIGMIFGGAGGAVFGAVLPLSISLVSTISLGAGIGYLFGFFAYQASNNKKRYTAS